MSQTQKRIAEFLQALANERNSSPHTIRSYGKDLRRFSEFLGSDLDLGEIDHKFIRSFLAELYAAGLSKASVAHALATLKSFLKWLGRNGRLAKNPAALVSAPKLPKRLPRVPSIEQLDRALSPKDDERSSFPERDLLILELLYGSGLRNSELCAIRMQDLSLAKQLLLIRGKGKKERMAPISDAAAQAIRNYLPRRSEVLARANKIAAVEALLISLRGTPLTSRSVARIVKCHAIAAGLPSETHPHSLRHAFGSHLLAEGADLRTIQELLGHERISTTQIYTQLSVEQVSKVYDETHPRAK